MYPARRLYHLALCLLLPLAPLPAVAADACLKQVFERYCLGGDFQTLLRQSPPPLMQTDDQDGQGAIFLDERERIYVMAFKGRIYKVVRQYRPTTQVRFDEVSQMVIAKYGQPQDRSQFPAYVDSRAARVVAIRRGDGRSVQVWPAGDGLHLELAWTREMGVALSYIVDALDAERHKVQAGGL